MKTFQLNIIQKMTKIEELIAQMQNNYGGHFTNGSHDLEELYISGNMKEYAELYCEEFRRNLLNSGYHYENLHIVDFTTVETLPLHPHE